MLEEGSSWVRRKANPEWRGDVKEGFLKRKTPELSLRAEGVI